MSFFKLSSSSETDRLINSANASSKPGGGGGGASSVASNNSTSIPPSPGGGSSSHKYYFLNHGKDGDSYQGGSTASVRDDDGDAVLENIPSNAISQDEFAPRVLLAPVRCGSFRLV
jgi:hypothetical protein